MQDCYATLEFLIQHFPFVSVEMRGEWRATVQANPPEGAYTVTINGVGYEYIAGVGETEGQVRTGIMAALANQTLVALAPYGLGALDLKEVVVASIEELTISGPPDAFVLEVRVPQVNHDYLTLLLKATECGVNCCAFGCDAQLYHAALTAYHFGLLWKASANGVSPADWDMLKLGPATISKGQSAGNVSISQLEKSGGPGQMVAMLRRRHISKVFCR